MSETQKMTTTEQTQIATSILKTQSKPTQELVWISESGGIAKQPCEHTKIPGFDADFCEVCRIWWVNRHERDKYYARKRSGLDHS
ncbi:hypothetical protein JYQ62_07625 [Nostoc sp. UHCC 0702]|nr:hypothetical protein JYQ62_07625 [Nostoc sp. UHCC 0702]